MTAPRRLVRDLRLDGDACDDRAPARHLDNNNNKSSNNNNNKSNSNTNEQYV